MTPIRNLKIPDHLPAPFTREEMETILTYLKSNAPEQAWNWYEFAFGTGMVFPFVHVSDFFKIQTVESRKIVERYRAMFLNEA